MSTLTFKINSLYVSYEPHSGLFSFGGCFEEAVNSLQDQLQALASQAIQTGGRRKTDAQD